MESVRPKLSLRLLLTPTFWEDMEDMATLDLDMPVSDMEVLDMPVVDMPVLDILVLDMVATAMAMASVRLKLSPRLLLTPTFWEDMEDMATLDLDMPVSDMEVLDMPVVDMP